MHKREVNDTPRPRGRPPKRTRVRTPKEKEKKEEINLVESKIEFFLRSTGRDSHPIEDEEIIQETVTESDINSRLRQFKTEMELEHFFDDIGNVARYCCASCGIQEMTTASSNWESVSLASVTIMPLLEINITDSCEFYQNGGKTYAILKELINKGI
jgi:hypothetical protein